MYYLKFTFLIAALLAAMTVAGGNKSSSYRDQLGGSFSEGSTPTESTGWKPYFACSSCS